MSYSGRVVGGQAVVSGSVCSHLLYRNGTLRAPKFEERVISTGYNGVPAGVINCLKGGCLRCKNPGGRYPSCTGYDLCICVHAEQNALLSAARFGIAVAGSTMYTTMEPCFGCLKELHQAAVKRIVYLHLWEPSDADPVMDVDKKREHDKLLAQFVSE